MIEALSSIHYKDYCHYVWTALSKRKMFKLFLWVSLACVVILGTYIVITLSKGGKITFVNVLPLIALGVFYIFYIAMYLGMTSAQYKRAKKAFNAEASYTFYNNKLVISEPGSKKGLDIFYESLQEIRESKKRIYFFISDNKSYMMRKDKFVKGNIIELREFLKTHCKRAKFKIKRA